MVIEYVQSYLYLKTPWYTGHSGRVPTALALATAVLVDPDIATVLATGDRSRRTGVCISRV